MGGTPERALTRDQVHDPADHDGGANKERPAVEAVAEHALRGLALRDAEDGRCERGEEQHGREMGGAEHQSFLPVRMLCASTAAMMFSNPATTMKRVPQSATVSWTESAPRPMARPTM